MGSMTKEEFRNLQCFAVRMEGRVEGRAFGFNTVDDRNPGATHNSEYTIIPRVRRVLKAMQDLYHQQ